MSRRALAVLPVLALVAILPSAKAEETKTALSPYDAIEPLRLSTSEPHAFWFPECLEYRVRWGFLEVGRSTLCSTETVKIDGHPAYHIVSEADSNGFVDAFYKVRDYNEAWLDASAANSWGYSKKLREGSYFKEEWALYDVGRRTFQAQTKNKKGEISFKTGTIPGAVFDILSSLYYVRMQPMDTGTEYTLDVNTKENWPLIVRILQRDDIRTPAGHFDCFVVEPLVRKEGIFIQKGKRLRVWMSDDARRIPVHMEAEVFIGHVSADLVSIH